MARRASEGEFNTFVRGLITEASPLTFPDNASIDEKNFVLSRDGSRRRRLGMDYEQSFVQVSTNQTVPSGSNLAYSTYLWENAGGIPELQILVVQIGSQLSFFDRNQTPISSGLISQETLSEVSEDTLLSYAVVDSVLVVATGAKDVLVFAYDDGTITSSTTRLKIRDLFGVEDRASDGTDLLDGLSVNTRPASSTDTHIYNLRNQTWGPPRATKDSDDLSDPISDFRAVAEATGDVAVEDGFIVFVEGEGVWAYRGAQDGPIFTDFVKGAPAFDSQGRPLRILKITSNGDLDYKDGPETEEMFDGRFLVWDGTAWDQVIDPNTVIIGEGAYPSNADAVTEFVFANTDNSSNRTLERFHPEDAAKFSPGSSRAPTGYFIIDALDRGISRKAEHDKLLERYPQLDIPVVSLPEDKTPGGAKAVANYAGRVWYAGFPGQVEEGDKESPILSSYVLFSQLIDSPSKVNKCYQESDPTAIEGTDLVDTDGGFIKLDGAYGVKRIIAVADALVVLASNGIWSIRGGSDFGFTATNYLVEKVSEHAIVGTSTAVVVDNTILFWGVDGIYRVARNELGGFNSENISENTIQTFYEAISDEDKTSCQGFYDSFDKKIRWLYGNKPEAGAEAKELILDTNLGAFYPSILSTISGGLPLPVALVEVKPFQLNSVTELVTYNGEQVTYNGDPVTYTRDRRLSATRETMYVTLTATSPVQFTFSFYRDDSFTDWASFDGTGVDAEAFVLTGYLGTGEFKRYKQVPYLYMHLLKTEDGFEGDFELTNQSSCLVQVQWDWTNSANSNRWGRTFQAYRLKRLYFPANIADPFETGEKVVTTRNKIRGKGRVLSMKISSEPGKDLRLLGWSFLLTENANV